MIYIGNQNSIWRKNKVIIRQYRKPIVPKYANYDYVKVYDRNELII